MHGKKGTNSTVLLIVVCFWTMLTMFSYLFDTKLTETQLSEFKPTDDVEDTDEFDLIKTVFGVAEDIPIIEYFVPILKMLSFQYVSVPPIITILLDCIAIITLIAILGMIIPG